MDEQKAKKYRNIAFWLTVAFLLGIPLTGADMIGCKTGRGVTAYHIDAMLLVISLGATLFFYGQQIRTRSEHWYRGITYTKPRDISFFAYAWMTGGVIIALLSIPVAVSMFVKTC